MISSATCRLFEKMTNRTFEAWFLIARGHDHQAPDDGGRCGERLEGRQPLCPSLMMEHRERDSDEEYRRTANAMVTGKTIQ
jgi:hypothetical protein